VKSISSLLQVASSLLIPIAIGLSSFTLFSALVDSGLIQHDLVYRYLFGHWVNRTTSAMFCIGVAALVIALKDILSQFAGIRKVQLELPTDLPPAENDEQLAQRLSERLNALPLFLHGHYLHQRLRSLFDYIRRSGASSSAETELRYLGQADEDRKHARYSFVRILIWAIPLLGFLGTVLGISEGLGKLGVSESEDLAAMMSGLQSSLYVAFDTTAQALVMSIGLMFTLYLADRLESQLLKVVDDRALELTGEFFEFTPAGNEASIQVAQLGRRMLAATRSAVRDQTELWKETITTAESAWTKTQQLAADNLRTHVLAEVEQVAGRIGSKLEVAVDNISTQTAETQIRTVETLNQSVGLLANMVQNTCDRLDQTFATAIAQSHQLVSDQLTLWQNSIVQNNSLLSSGSQQSSEQLHVVRELATRLETIASLQDSINRGLDAVASTSRMEYALTELANSIKELRLDLQHQREKPTEPVAQTEPRIAPFALRLNDVARRAA